MSVEKVKVLIKNQSANEIAAASHCSVSRSNFDAVSDTTGSFETYKPTITVTLSTYYVISGFSAIFEGISLYPTNCTITYTFADDTTYVDTLTPDCPIVLSEITSSKYCKSVVLVVNSMNRMSSSVTYQNCYFGHVLEFAPEEINDLTITTSSDLSGITAPYHTLDGTFYLKSSTVAITSSAWISKPIVVSTNLKTIGTYYLQTATLTGNGFYQIEAVSALGLLAAETYAGYAVQGGTSTTAVITNIVNGLITVDTSWCTGDEAMSWGIIPEGGDRREALATLGLGHAKYVDGDGQFQSVDTTSTPIALTSTAIKDTRIYQRPEVLSQELVKRMVITNYDDDDSYGDDARQYNAGGATRYLYERDSATATKTGTKEVDIQCLMCATVSQVSQAHWTAVCTALKNFYARNRIWHGKILWNTATNEGRVGTRVTVPCVDGSTITGNVISSILRFSGVSVTAEIQVLEAGTW